LFFKQLTKI